MSRTVLLSAKPPTDLPGTVLTLNHRAARRLGVQPLRLTDLIQRTFEGTTPNLEIASATLSQRLLTAAVRQVIPDVPAGPTARSHLSVVRELIRSGIPLNEVSISHPSLAQLAQLTLAYEQLLQERQLIDQAQLATVAAQHVKPQLLTITGYLRLLPDEQRFLNAACADGSLLHLPWADHPYFQEVNQTADYFALQGWAVSREIQQDNPYAQVFLGHSIQLPEQSALLVLPSEDAEIRAALGEIKKLLLDHVAPEDIALVVPDDERWEAPIRSVANEYGIPVRFTTSVPAAQTRVGRWLLKALQAIEDGGQFDSVLNLLAHPLDQGITGEASQQILEQKNAEQPDWGKLGIQLNDLHWPEHSSRAQWLKRLRQFIESRGIAKKAKGQDGITLDYVQAELNVLATPAYENIPRENFFEEVRELLSLVAVPTDFRNVSGIELLTLPSLIGAWVPYVFFLGMADGSFPPPLQDSAVLDFLERKHLQAAGLPLETAGTLSRRNAVIFWAALQAAGQATFSYARLVKGSSGLPSPYLLPLQLTERAAPLYACSPQEARRSAVMQSSSYIDDLLPTIRAHHEIEIQRLQGPEYSQHDGLGLPAVDISQHIFSASQLNILGQCAFKWWMQYGLQLLNRDGQPARDLGQIRHEVLKKGTLKAIKEKTDLRETLLSNLDALWLQEEAHVHWPQTERWLRERPEHLESLKRAIKSPSFIGANATPLSAESSFYGHWYGLNVRGVVDRIDDLNGKAFFVDYKSGTGKPVGIQNSYHQLKLDIQLPLYVQAATPQLYPERVSGGAIYLSLKTGEVIDRIKLTPSEYETAAQHMISLLQNGQFPPRPDKAQQACLHCPWQATCRRGPRLERKEFL